MVASEASKTFEPGDKVQLKTLKEYKGRQRFAHREFLFYQGEAIFTVLRVREKQIFLKEYPIMWVNNDRFKPAVSKR